MFLVCFSSAAGGKIILLINVKKNMKVVLEFTWVKIFAPNHRVSLFFIIVNAQCICSCNVPVSSVSFILFLRPITNYGVSSKHHQSALVFYNFSSALCIPRHPTGDKKKDTQTSHEPVEFELKALLLSVLLSGVKAKAEDRPPMYR